MFAKLPIILFFISIPLVLKAETFQVLHTNDLHSFMEHADHYEDQGGFATIKNLITEEKYQRSLEDIPTLTLDAGDFSEGSSFYLANRGRSSYEAMNLMGHNAVVIGNHDYLMGTQELDQILGEVSPQFSFLGGNFKADARFKNINKHLKAYKIFNIKGLQVGVFGLTTNDPLYKWRLDGAQIVNEVQEAKKIVKQMKKEGAEIIIALTHIGVFKDRILATLVPEIDLVVGGHSHDTLKTPIWINHLHKKIPIVQTGEHGFHVGKLLLDWDHKKKKLNVLDYQLLPALKKVYGEDSQVLEHIELAYEFLYQAYGEEWLEKEVVGKSELLPESLGGDPQLWGHFITDAMRSTAKSHVGIHTQALSGSNYPLGDITRRKLFDSNPRIFEFDEKYGYRVYTSEIPGFLLKFVFKAVINFKIPLYFSGVSFNYDRDKKGICKNISDIKFDGEKIKPWKLYRVAMSEAIIRGGLGITSAVKYLFRNSKRLDTTMWQSLEDWSQKVGVVTSRYLDQAPSFLSQKLLKSERNFMAPKGPTLRMVITSHEVDIRKNPK